VKTRSLRTRVATFLLALAGLCIAPSARAQGVYFSFDSAPPYTPLPVSVTEGGITATLSGTGSGYSIQSVNAVPIHPVGFSGNLIYPSGVFAADLLISYSRTLTSFSIMYSLNELGCDDSATMRVTAYINGALVGTNTATIANPNGNSYPVGTLGCSFPQGFNSVVVHWDKKGPLCQDYGPNFLADNMYVTPAWLDLGFAVAGTAGKPRLVGSGTLAAGSSNQLSLALAKSSSLATLVFGTSAINVPFKGGVLVPSPLVLVAMTSTATGTAILPFAFPAGVPVGTALFMQFWVQDSGAVQGFSASNAVKGITT